MAIFNSLLLFQLLMRIWLLTRLIIFYGEYRVGFLPPLLHKPAVAKVLPISQDPAVRNNQPFQQCSVETTEPYNQNINLINIILI